MAEDLRPARQPWHSVVPLWLLEPPEAEEGQPAGKRLAGLVPWEGQSTQEAEPRVPCASPGLLTHAGWAAPRQPRGQPLREGRCPPGKPRGRHPAVRGHAATSQGWSHGPAGAGTCWRGSPGRGAAPARDPGCHAAPRARGGRRRLRHGGGLTAGWASRQSLPTPSRRSSPGSRSPSFRPGWQPGDAGRALPRARSPPAPSRGFSSSTAASPRNGSSFPRAPAASELPALDEHRWPQATAGADDLNGLF